MQRARASTSCNSIGIFPTTTQIYIARRPIVSNNINNTDTHTHGHTKQSPKTTNTEKKADDANGKIMAKNQIKQCIFRDGFFYC